MTLDEREPPAITPSFFVRWLSILGALIAISAIAGIITAVLVTFSRWDHFRHSIFGLAWGVTARWFQFSVRQGIKHNLDTDTLTPDRRRVLGEQLAMLQATRWFIRAELLASAVLLIVQLILR